jgi:hypothetical protein
VTCGLLLFADAVLVGDFLSLLLFKPLLLLFSLFGFFMLAELF